MNKKLIQAKSNVDASAAAEKVYKNALRNLLVEQVGFLHQCAA